MRHCALALLCTVLVACGSKSGDKAKPVGDKPKTSVAKPAPIDAARKRVTGPTRAEVDCATLLTIDDVASVCGATLRALKATKAERPGRNCNRAGGSYNARLMFMLSIGTGDVGHPGGKLKLHEQTLGAVRSQTVVINKKPFELQLRASHHKGKKPPCDAAQLKKLANTVVARLP